MKDRFYYNWLFVNEEKDLYKDPLNIVELANIEFKETENIEQVEPGYGNLYGNRLRNGNNLQNFTLNKNNEYRIKPIYDDETIQLYQRGNRLLAGHPGIWAIYDTQSKTSLKTGNWHGFGGTFYCENDNFLIFDNMLQTLDTKGELLHNTMITLPPGIGVNEIAKFNEFTIVSAYVSQDEFQDMMPKELRPCGFLEVIKDEAFNEPDGEMKMRDREESSTIAYVDENIIYPIYLNEYIVQPISGGLVILNYDLIIQRVITGSFDPQLVSCGSNDIIYAAVMADDKEQLLGLTLDGGQIFANDIPPALGRLATPPLVASDGSIYWVGTGGFVKYSPAGEEILVRRFGNESDFDLYPVLYGEILTVAFGDKITAYDNDGEILYSLGGIPGTISSALLTDGSGNYFIGTKNGLYSITKK